MWAVTGTSSVADDTFPGCFVFSKSGNMAVTGRVVTIDVGGVKDFEADQRSGAWAKLVRDYLSADNRLYHVNQGVGANFMAIV